MNIIHCTVLPVSLVLPQVSLLDDVGVFDQLHNRWLFHSGNQLWLPVSIIHGWGLDSWELSLQAQLFLQTWEYNTIPRRHSNHKIKMDISSQAKKYSLQSVFFSLSQMFSPLHLRVRMFSRIYFKLNIVSVIQFTWAHSILWRCSLFMWVYREGWRIYFPFSHLRFK